MSLSELALETDEGSKKAVELFGRVREKMGKVGEFRNCLLTLEKKMGELTKTRLASLREKEN